MLENRTSVLSELNTFFQQQQLPRELKVNSYSTITDVPNFVEKHLAVAAQPDPKGLNEAFVDRLLELKQLLETQSAGL